MTLTGNPGAFHSLVRGSGSTQLPPHVGRGWLTLILMRAPERKQSPREQAVGTGLGAAKGSRVPRRGVGGGGGGHGPR